MNEPAMHQHSPQAAFRTCGYCLQSFVPRVSWGRYCSKACRTESNAKRAAEGLRASVSKVSVLKSGALSVVIRFSPIEKERALKSLEPGKLVGVVCDG